MAQALEGDFAAAQGLVYTTFQRSTHVIPTADAHNRIDDDWRIYGYDAGWSHPRVLVELGRTRNGQLIAVDEFYQPETHLEAAIDWLDTDTKPQGKLYAEHDPEDINRFTKAGYHVRQPDKALDPGIADVRRRLGHDTNDQVGFLVAKDCEHLIREFLGYKTDDVGTAHATDHCLDVLRYAIHGLDDGARITTWDDTCQASMPVINVTGKAGDGYY